MSLGQIIVYGQLFLVALFLAWRILLLARRARPRKTGWKGASRASILNDKFMVKLGAALILLSSVVPAFASTRLPPEYKARWETVEACMGASVPTPSIEFDKTVACPTSGNKRCMKSYPFFQCGDIWCGASGAYYPSTNTIWLADKYDLSFEHEAVHAVLYLTGDPGWRDHSRPAFAACGVPR